MGHKNVRINCIAPGLIKTDFARALWEDTGGPRKPRLATTPLRRIGEPDEIGGIVAFLASKARVVHDRVGDRGRRRRDDCVKNSGRMANGQSRMVEVHSPLAIRHSRHPREPS